MQANKSQLRFAEGVLHLPLKWHLISQCWFRELERGEDEHSEQSSNSSVLEVRNVKVEDEILFENS